MNDLVYGRNAVREALRAQRRTLVRLFVAAGANEAGTLAAVTQQARDVGVVVERVDRRELERMVHGVNHQGVILECGPYPYADVDAMLARAAQRAEPALLLMLDHLQDPQNIGTLLRTAEVVGVHGVITPGRRAAEITPAVVNAASGATEHLLIAEVTNIVQTIQQLQRAGVWVAGVAQTVVLTLGGPDAPGSLVSVTMDGAELLLRETPQRHSPESARAAVQDDFAESVRAASARAALVQRRSAACGDPMRAPSGATRGALRTCSGARRRRASLRVRAATALCAFGTSACAIVPCSAKQRMRVRTSMSFRGRASSRGFSCLEQTTGRSRSGICEISRRALIQITPLPRSLPLH